MQQVQPVYQSFPCFWELVLFKKFGLKKFGEMLPLPHFPPCLNGLELTRFNSMSKAPTSTGIPYATLLYAKGIPDLEFTLMENNMSLNLSIVKMPQ